VNCLGRKAEFGKVQKAGSVVAFSAGYLRASCTVNPFDVHCVNSSKFYKTKI